ncbi:PAS domain S-box protein [Thalassobaculum sp.]|uniref:PAS domain S-box protein n=1 Tax=Thalassobaculum sp. TaxID=2022740 RepID=UPI0032EEB312
MVSVDTYIENLGLLSIGTVALYLSARSLSLPPTKWQDRMIFGAILGVVSAIVMYFPIQGPLGAVFDTRAGALVVAGYFGGPVAGLVAALFGAVARYTVGGAAVVGGITSVFLYAGAGALYAAYAPGWVRGRGGIVQMTLLAGFSTLAVLPSFFIGQSFPTGLAILSTRWVELVGGNLLSVLLLGQVVQRFVSDLSERDAVKAKLRWTDLARDAAGIWIWSYDIERDRLTWDDNMSGQAGLVRRGKVGTFDAFEALVDRRDFERVKAAFHASMERGTEFDVSFRTRGGPEGVRHMRVHGTFSGGTPGKPTFALGVTIDETAQVMLLADNDLKGSALDSAVCGVLITDALADNAIVYVNSAFTRISGYTAAEVLGRNCRFMNEGIEEQPGLVELRAHIRSGLPYETTVLNRRRDGTEFWNSLRVSPIHDANGMVTHFIGIQEDVTEHRAAQAAVIAARDELQAVLTSAPYAILTIDEHHRITTVNQAAEKLFDWPAAEIVGQAVDILLPADMRSGHAQLVSNYLVDPGARAGPMAGLRIVQARRRDGTTFSASVSLARYEHCGRPAVAVTAHDMTEAVAAKDRLTEISSELARQLDAAQAANFSKNRFLANMSHELRTPLNAIMGFSEMLEAAAPERIDPERVREYAGHIHRSGAHLLDLINDVLDLSKIESDAFPIQIEAYDAVHIVQGAIETIQPIAASKDIVVHVESDAFDPILCDRRAIHQCTLNILSNAIKFSPRKSSVLMRIEADESFGYIRITDEGPGISAEIVEQIGKPFVRSSHPGVASIEGTGLGLAITQNLMLKQGGSLKVESAIGHGTTATLTIPLRPTAQRNVNL